MLRTFAMTVLFLAASLAAFAQQPDWDAIEIKADHVAGSVYMLYGVGGFAGGNIGVSVGEDGIVLVDDQFEPLVPKIQAALSGLTDAPVRFVLNTHHHGDHTHGNKVFGHDSTIIAHDNVRARIAAEDAFDGQPGTPAPAQALPVLTFDSEVTLHLNGEEVRGVHFPVGHTDGDTIVYFTGSNVVHMGDDFFNGMFPFIDLDSGGTVGGYIAAMRKVHDELPADVKIIPGHGPLATRSDLQVNLEVLEATAAVIQKAIDDGKTLEQIQEEKLLAEWDSYSWPFITSERHAAQLYRGLGGGQ